MTALPGLQSQLQSGTKLTLAIPGLLLTTDDGAHVQTSVVGIQSHLIVLGRWVSSTGAHTACRASFAKGNRVWLMYKYTDNRQVPPTIPQTLVEKP